MGRKKGAKKGKPPADVDSLNESLSRLSVGQDSTVVAEIRNLINAALKEKDTALKVAEEEKEKALKVAEEKEKALKVAGEEKDKALEELRRKNEAEAEASTIDERLRIHEFFLEYPAFKPFRSALLKLYTLDKNDVISRRAFSFTRYGILSVRIIRDHPEHLVIDKIGHLRIKVTTKTIPRFVMPERDETSPSYAIDLLKSLGLLQLDFGRRCMELFIKNCSSSVESNLVKSIGESIANSQNYKNTDLDTVSDTVTGFIWDEILFKCLSFNYCRSSLPEEQYRAGLWAKLIEGFLGNHLCRGMFFKYEYRIKELEPSYGLNQMVDIAITVKTAIGETPIFLCEVSAHASDLDHKDYQKLPNEMHAALWRTVQLCEANRVAPNDLNLVVYGLYVSGLDFQVCTMHPIFTNEGNGKYISIFHTEKHWKFSLASPFISKCEEGKNCPACQSGVIIFDNAEMGKNASSDPAPFEAKDESKVLQDKYQDIEQVEMQESNKADHGDKMPVPSSSQRLDLHDLKLEDILPGLSQLALIVSQVTAYGQSFISRLENVERKPDGFTKDYPADYLPQSSRSNSTSGTPSKDRPKVPGNSVRISGRKSGKKSRNGTNVSNILIGNTNCVLIRKRKSLNEIYMLESFRGSLHVVELFHSYAYSKRNEMILFEEALEPLNPYQQIPDYLDYPSLIHGYCLQFLLDMIDALIFLREQCVIHRDISPRNVMFSSYLQTWKLIDFESAIHVKDTFQLHGSDYHGGTRKYTAPEFDSGQPYDFSVDAYSLGQVYLNCVEAEIVVYAVTDGDADKYSILLAQLATGFTAKASHDRTDLESAKTRLVSLLPRIRSFYLYRGRFDMQQPDILDYYPRLNYYLGLVVKDDENRLPCPRKTIVEEIERQIKNLNMHYIPDDPESDNSDLDDEEGEDKENEIRQALDLHDIKPSTTYPKKHVK